MSHAAPRSNRPLGPLALAALLLGACGTPAHLQYDFARAYSASMTTQADLKRPSVANDGYVLTGREGLLLRQRVEEETTDKESGKAESTSQFAVQ